MKGFYSLIFFFVTMLASCGNGEMRLVSFSVPPEASVTKLDSSRDYSLCLYSVTVTKALGKMDIDFVIARDMPFPRKGIRIINGKNGLRVSNEFVAIVEPYGIQNWGWFLVRKGKIDANLPHIDTLVDSLQTVYGKSYFVRHKNGIIYIFKKGKKIRSFDYGDLQYDSVITKSSNLLPGLYRVKNKALILISNDPDDLFKQEDGEYYVPSPGYGVIKKVRKESLYRAIDSILRVTPIPAGIRIPAE